jgi:ABC-type transport system involved in multi-copper enzyme maturation permease subunit
VPVYEESYRGWGGTLSPRPRTWWIIARTGVRLQWRRGMIILLMISALPFVVRAFQIYAATRLQNWAELAEAVQQLKVDASFFAAFLHGQSFFLLLTTVIAGSGLIANDRRFRALPLYFSKPVTLWDYLLGKTLVVCAYGVAVTLVPAVLLFLIRLVLASDATFFHEYGWVLFSIVGQSLLMILPLAGLVLVLSAAAGSARSAAILFFAAWMVPDIIRAILSGLTGLGYVSLPTLLRQTGALLFGLELPFRTSPWGSLAVLVGLMALAVLALRARVRPTEVVR